MHSIAVSSANNEILVQEEMIYNRNNNGPKIESWRTPVLITFKSDFMLCTCTKNNLLLTCKHVSI